MDDFKMSKSKSDQRPLSPHLSVYKWQLHAITSILTRITGNALIVGVILFVLWLIAAATSEANFLLMDAVISSWLGQLVLLGSLWALWYHTLAGIRHLIWDHAVWLDINRSRLLGWAVVFGSFVLTFLTILFL
jgi:succinate dehydrogenase / fumarate reductase cytochrome b subunit|tara:strand:- start:404 stop:802 length:399 start_codon:yes stop_codon:yes gene_type:complete